jgi:preprotein translocase subunit Sec61beta
MSKFHNLTVAQLYKALDGYLIDGDHAIRDACVVLVELRQRGERPEVTRSGVFKWFREIATEQLTPRAVLVFADACPTVLTKLSGQPRDYQNALADGKRIECAHVDDKLNVETRNIEVVRMNKSVMDAVFAPNGSIRPVEKQAEILVELAKAKASRKAEFKPVVIKANTGADTVTVNGVDVSSVDLANALQELGYVITRQAIAA